MTNQSDLITGFERGVKFALCCVEQKQAKLKCEIEYLSWMLENPTVKSSYSIRCNREKRSELKAALKELDDLHSQLSLVQSTNEQGD